MVHFLKLSVKLHIIYHENHIRKMLQGFIIYLFCNANFCSNTPKKTSMANISSAGDSTAGFLPKAEPVVVNIPVSPGKTML